MASNLHDGTASSFLDAMINLGPNPNMDTANAFLRSFGELNSQEQDAVIQSPKVNIRPFVQHIEKKC